MGTPALSVATAAANAPADSARWRSLGRILVDAGRINSGQLNQGLETQSQLGLHLGEALVRLGFLDAASLCDALVHQTGLPTANLEEQTPDPQAIALIPSQFASHHKLVPLKV